jgi:hypothetical protein
LLRSTGGKSLHTNIAIRWRFGPRLSAGDPGSRCGDNVGILRADAVDNCLNCCLLSARIYVVTLENVLDNLKRASNITNDLTFCADHCLRRIVEEGGRCRKHVLDGLKVADSRIE